LLARMVVDLLDGSASEAAVPTTARDATPTRWLSQRPRVMQLEGLLTPQECEALIELGKPLVKPWPEEYKRGRRSEGAFLPLPARREALVQRLEEALALHAR